MDPVARAREIAARLAATAIPQDVLGKRKSRWGEEDSSISNGPKKQKKVYIPVDKYPDINFMGLLIGPRGSNQKRMQDESGAKILIRGKGSSAEPGEDDDEELHVVITGDTDEAIAKGQAAVESILFNPQQAMRLKSEQLRKVAELNGTLKDDYGSSGAGYYGPNSKTIEMQVPRELVGYIIGRGGETIRELQNKSGAQIQIVREEIGAPQTPHRFVSVEGGEETIERAKQLIQQLIDERLHGGGGRMDSGSGSMSRYGSGMNPDGTETIEMHVPNERVGLIIGRAGATIKSIQQRTETSINIPQTADPNNPSMRLITITGSQQAKEAAKAEILSIMNEDQRNGGGGGGGQIIYMQVPNDRVGVVIGKRGETVKGIQDRFGVRIQIPQVMDPGSNPPVRTISIQGAPEALAVAKQEIDMVILNGAGTHGTGYSSSSSYAGYEQAYGQQQYGQYDAAYYQQYAVAAAASVDPSASATTEQTDATAAADPNDPNTYWNGFYEYAAYYGIDAANEAWGVTGEAAVASAEAYRQYQETNATAAVAEGTDASATTETTTGEEGEKEEDTKVRSS